MTHVHRRLSRHIHTMCPIALPPSGAIGDRCTLQHPLPRLRVSKTRHRPKTNRSSTSRSAPQRYSLPRKNMTKRNRSRAAYATQCCRALVLVSAAALRLLKFPGFTSTDFHVIPFLRTCPLPISVFFLMTFSFFMFVNLTSSLIPIICL